MTGAAMITTAGGLDPALVDGIVRRAGSPGFERFRAQLRSSGYCTRPVRLRGEICDQHGQRVWSTHGEPDGVLRRACGNRREAVCHSCAERYRQDAYHLIAAGLRGGKGVPDSVTAHPFVFVTLTAPSFGAVHGRPLGKDGEPGRCRPRRDAPVCEHGVRMSCGQVHNEHDACLGQPLCVQCFDHQAAVLWNNTLGELWRRTTVYLPRHLAAVLGITQKRLRGLARFSYIKVAEYQARGLVHLHVAIRIDPAMPDYRKVEIRPPDARFTTQLLEHAVHAPSTRFTRRSRRTSRQSSASSASAGDRSARFTRSRSPGSSPATSPNTPRSQPSWRAGSFTRSTRRPSSASRPQITSAGICGWHSDSTGPRSASPPNDEQKPRPTTIGSDATHGWLPTRTSSDTGATA